MKICIHRGTKEIGGSCVELTTANSRIIIDVGMPLVDEAGEPFDSRVIRGKSISELLELKILPRVSGLFDNSAPAPDAILLSHAHLDHSGLLQFARPEIPVYLSKGTSKMLLAGSIFAAQPGLERERCQIFEPESPFRVGDFQVTANPVDHSAFDSMAFLIEAEGKTILYSGDLRLHGRKPGMARRLIASAAGCSIDALLMEGTHMGANRERAGTEKQLEEVVLKHVQTAPGIVLAMFSPMNVDRLVTFYKAARRVGRTFVVDPYAAFVMHLVAGQCKIPRPTAEAGIRVFYNQYFDRSHERRNLKKIYEMFLADRISRDDLLASAGTTLMVFRPSMTEPDFAGTLPQAAACLYSYWEGYLKKPEWEDFKRKVEQVSGTFKVCHTSGHIYLDDLVAFVRAVNPRIVIPMHTFEPGKFGEHFPNAVMLEDGTPLSL